MKPNFIIVMTDQQRADLRKSLGYKLDTMPFLDEWGKGGLDFSRAYTSNPTCIPARVSMFTGRYSESHKVRTNHNTVDAVYTNDLLGILRSQGYKTALCGKNHTHHTGEEFDFHRLNGHLGNEENEDITPEEIAFGKFLTATNHMESHECSPGGVTVQHPYRNITSALEFIDSVDQKNPFFLWISFAEPHNPYQVPTPYFDMFPPETLPIIETANIELISKGHRYPWLRGMWEKVLGEDIENRILRARSNYLGMLRLIDDQFKRLITELDERNLTHNTIIIYLSDHGDYAGEYGLIRKGADLPDVLTRIPMIWRGPGIDSIGKSDGVCISIVDILPTICEILEIEAPFGCQGKSILPILRGREILEEEYAVAYAESGYSGLYWTKNDDLSTFCEGASDEQYTVFDCLNSWTQCGQVRMIRKGDYRIQVDMMGTGYLYNLKYDPYETSNLWDNDAFTEIKADMLNTLVKMMLRACDTLPAPHSRYRTKIHPRGLWEQNFSCSDQGIRNFT